MQIEPPSAQRDEVPTTEPQTQSGADDHKAELAGRQESVEGYFRLPLSIKGLISEMQIDMLTSAENVQIVEVAAAETNSPPEVQGQSGILMNGASESIETEVHDFYLPR